MYYTLYRPMSNADAWTHIPVRESIRDQLRKEADAHNLTYGGLLKRLMSHPQDGLSPSDTDYLIEKFAETVSEVTDHTPETIEKNIRDRLPEDHR